MKYVLSLLIATLSLSVAANDFDAKLCEELDGKYSKPIYTTNWQSRQIFTCSRPLERGFDATYETYPVDRSCYVFEKRDYLVLSKKEAKASD